MIFGVVHLSPSCSFQNRFVPPAHSGPSLMIRRALSRSRASPVPQFAGWATGVLSAVGEADPPELREPLVLELLPQAVTANSSPTTHASRRRLGIVEPLLVRGAIPGPS